MIKPQIPENEKERLENLKAYAILDTLPEKEYDEITYLASQICGTPISLISLIDETRQWFKSHYGLQATETPKEYAFCAHAINDQDRILIVPDSRMDERFHDNPLVTDYPFVIFYAGVPLITPKGYSLGTLCVIDNVPRNLDESQIKTLKVLANQLVKLLELRISIIELNKSEQKLKELNATKDKLFSIIGHDLRGPIGGFKTLIELLISGYDLSDSKNLMDILQIIHKTANSTYDLLENLLAWAKSQRNEILFAPEKIKLKEITLLTNDLFAELSKNKHINIIYDVPEDTMIFADKNMLMTVLRNLISNAIKFTPNGKQIRVIADKNDKEHIITIKDEGTGIKPENLTKLFKNTEHLSTFGTNGEKGSGLGLLLCKDFIEKHKGRIWVESELGKGSAFIFTLPITDIAVSNTVSAILPPAVLHADDAKPLKIALAGDSTVADYPPESPIRGWGQSIGSFFKENVKIQNFAVGGRSTKTFLSEGRWVDLLKSKPDCILLQFGHNDSHVKGKPESTDANTDYKDYLRKYADEAKAAVIPIIFITPMHRRTFDEDGEPTKELLPYANAMKEIASEKGIICIDLYSLSGLLLKRLGDNGSGDLSCSPTDRTHFSKKGAETMAGLIADELKGSASDLKGYINSP